MRNELNDIILQVMRQCRNFFIHSQETGDFAVVNGRITLSETYKSGQYILLQDDINIVTGIYKISGINDIFPNDYLLDDEELNVEFEGNIYGLAIPPDFLILCKEILSVYKNPAMRISPYVSETVVNLHSHSKAVNKDTGAPLTWLELYQARFKPFIRMFPEVSI